MIQLPELNLPKLSRDMLVWVLVALAVGAGGGFYVGKNGLPSFVIPGVTPAVGPRQIFIVRESEKDTNATSTLLNNLQSSNTDFRAYLTAKGHVLTVFDDDAKDENNQPLKVLVPFQPFKETGEVLIRDPSGKLLSRDPLPSSVTGVLDLIKKAGG